MGKQSKTEELRVGDPGSDESRGRTLETKVLAVEEVGSRKQAAGTGREEGELAMEGRHSSFIWLSEVQMGRCGSHKQPHESPRDNATMAKRLPGELHAHTSSSLSGHCGGATF